MLNSTRRASEGAIVALASLALSCTDAMMPPEPGPLQPGPFVVSSPVPDPAASASGTVRSRFALFTLTPSVVYVSLPPGAIPNGIAAAIRNDRTGSSTNVHLVGGGFDPVTLPALVGDTIGVTVQVVTSGSPLSFRFTVQATTRPTVVRTSPPSHKRDVPLNAVMVIVFSEPIDAATLNGSSVQLYQGTTAVPGQLAFADAAQVQATFTPDALLAVETDYQLTVSQGIRDLNGQALNSAVTASFTTGTTTPATNLVFASLEAGPSYTCGVTLAGAAYCWGHNGWGNLGDGTTTDRLTPALVEGALSFTGVSTGDNTCGVTTAAFTYCWGWNHSDELGPSPTTPVLVAGGPGGLRFTQVSAGTGQDCGVTTAGVAYCWGFGLSGELGDGTQSYHADPEPVAGVLSFAGVSAGFLHTCGVTVAGAAYCWGDNRTGELGDGTTNQGLTPLLVAGGLNFKEVSAGSHITCGLTAAGAVYCWGPNDWGQLGDGTTTQRLTPVPVAGGLSFTAVRAGGMYACGLTTGGAVYCWGLNDHGQLGDGTTTQRLTPVPVAGGLSFTTLSLTATHTCGLTAAGAAYCWGDNRFGALGDGTAISSSVPVKVAGQP